MVYINGVSLDMETRDQLATGHRVSAKRVRSRDIFSSPRDLPNASMIVGGQVARAITDEELLSSDNVTLIELHVVQ